MLIPHWTNYKDFHQLWARSKSITDEFHKLCTKAHVTKIRQHGTKMQIPSKLEIKVSNNINALTLLSVPIVEVSTKDVMTLSKSHIKALLAHEVGHLRQQTNHKYGFGLSLRECWFAFLIVIIINVLNTGLSNAMIVFGVLFGALLLVQSHSRVMEYDADITGMELIGLKPMLNLMVYFQEKEDKQHDELLGYIKDLRTCPIACLKCIMLLIKWDFACSQITSKWRSHPSYYDRARYLTKMHKHLEKK